MAQINKIKRIHAKNCLTGESFANIFASFLYPVIYTSLPFFATSAIFKTHMPNPRSPEEVLWNVFPLLLIAIALVGGIILLPRLNATNLDDRSRASEPKIIVTPIPAKTTTPEIICSALYDPVCDPKTGKTYSNSCEAGLAKVLNATPGECKSDKPTNSNSKTPLSLPESN